MRIIEEHPFTQSIQLLLCYRLHIMLKLSKSEKSETKKKDEDDKTKSTYLESLENLRIQFNFCYKIYDTHGCSTFHLCSSRSIVDHLNKTWRNFI